MGLGQLLYNNETKQMWYWVCFPQLVFLGVLVFPHENTAPDRSATCVQAYAVLRGVI